MRNSSRPRRVEVTGARVDLAGTIVDLVNLSQTGVVVWVSYPLPLHSEWPLVLDLPGIAPARVAGRVVRSEAADVILPGSGLQGHYMLALAFVDPSEALQSVLARICGADTET